ncbi:MAG: ABC transporter permease [Candidatus Aminicenantes bacterium]|nr:ABC transporter permease [Candidatus Aminicenantes bacterium]
MPIKEKGYSHWDGEFSPKKLPWWPITRYGIKLSLKKKFFKLAYALALVPAIVFLVGIYLAERIEDFSVMMEGGSTLIKVDPALFKTYLTNEFLLFMIIIILVFAGAGLISDDLKYNSLQLYFSRPLRKQDYLLGKASVLVGFLLFLTLVPGLILFFMKLIFSGSLKFFGDFPLLPLSIIGYSIFITVFFSFYTLLLSSISKSKRYVIILMVGIYFFSDILYAIFYNIFPSRSPYFSLFSIKVNLQQLGAAFFGVKAPQNVPWIYSLIILAGICCLSVAVLFRKVKSVEIVK